MASPRLQSHARQVKLEAHRLGWRWMFRQFLIFLLAVLIIVAVFVFGEWLLSPTFYQCISEGTSNNGVIRAYAGCSGEFIETHYGAITALATIIIAAFTATLWYATNKQANLTRQAFIADKRAAVFASGFISVWEHDPTTNLYNWRFRPVWQNSGETPTRRLQLYAACEVRNSPLAHGYDFKQTTMPPGPGMLGPKATSMGGIVPAVAITPQDIVDAQQNKKFIYLWGWATYFDVFPNTPQHVTRFCWIILAGGNPRTFTPPPPGQPDSVGFINVYHSEGNCADDECP